MLRLIGVGSRRIMATSALRIGSTCTGYGGLDMAITSVFGGEVVWCADNERHVATILAARYPGIPNLGDVTAIGWREAAPVDIISAGFPCQDISYNGRGAGLKGARSGIWRNIAEGIRILRPQLVVVENVAGLKQRGLDRVLGDLAEMRYYTDWTSIRASDVGAPHRRERVFILAHRRGSEALLTAAYARGQRQSRRPASGEAASRWPSGGSQRLGAIALSQPLDDDDGWGRFGEAIRRWEETTGRAAPYPTDEVPAGKLVSRRV